MTVELNNRVGFLISARDAARQGRDQIARAVCHAAQDVASTYNQPTAQLGGRLAKSWLSLENLDEHFAGIARLLQALASASGQLTVDEKPLFNCIEQAMAIIAGVITLLDQAPQKCYGGVPMVTLAAAQQAKPLLEEANKNLQQMKTAF